MVHCVYTPGSPLSDFVDKFWSEEGYAPSHARERALPTGTTELIFNLLDDELRVFGRQDHDRPGVFAVL